MRFLRDSHATLRAVEIVRTRKNGTAHSLSALAFHRAACCGLILDGLRKHFSRDDARYVMGLISTQPEFFVAWPTCQACRVILDEALEGRAAASLTLVDEAPIVRVDERAAPIQRAHNADAAQGVSKKADAAREAAAQGTDSPALLGPVRSEEAQYLSTTLRDLPPSVPSESPRGRPREGSALEGEDDGASVRRTD